VDSRGKLLVPGDRYKDRVHNQISSLFLQGKVKYDEHITEGFENMFEAFTGLFTGDNTGKAVVKI
jgi:NADPH-dependent curcumin reductase CurA